jgi:hypothetical protein
MNMNESYEEKTARLERRVKKLESEREASAAISLKNLDIIVELRREGESLRAYLSEARKENRTVKALAEWIVMHGYKDTPSATVPMLYTCVECYYAKENGHDPKCAVLQAEKILSQVRRPKEKK